MRALIELKSTYEEARPWHNQALLQYSDQATPWCCIVQEVCPLMQFLSHLDSLQSAGVDLSSIKHSAHSKVSALMSYIIVAQASTWHELQAQDLSAHDYEPVLN